MKIIRYAGALLLIGLLELGCGSGGGAEPGSGVSSGLGVEGRDAERLRRRVNTLTGEKEYYATELTVTTERLRDLEDRLETLVAEGEADTVSDQAREAASAELLEAANLRVKTLDTALEEQGAEIGGMQSQYAALEGRYVKLEGTLKEKVVALGVLEEKLKFIAEEVSSTSEKGAALEALIKRLEGQVEGAEAQITSVNEERATLKAKLQEVTAEKLKYQGDSWPFEMEVNTGKRETKTLTATNKQLRAELRTLRAERAAARSRVEEAKVLEEEPEEEEAVATPSTAPSVKPDAISDSGEGASPPLAGARDEKQVIAVTPANGPDKEAKLSVAADRAARKALREERLALLARVAAGDLDVIEALKQLQEGVETRDRSGSPALLVAARNGQAAMMEALLMAGAKVYSTDGRGNTALHHAAAANQVYTIAMLHAKGLDIETQNRNHFTPLHVATEASNLDAIRALADFGAKLSLSYYDGGTVDPLLIAYADERWEVAAVLREVGAKRGIHFYTNHGDIAGIVSRLEEDPMAIRLTHPGANDTALLVAMKMQQYAAASYLLASGANVFDADISFNTLLSIAAHNDSEEGVTLILENGYPINRTTGPPNSLYAQIHKSAEIDSIDMVQFLLEKGADVNQVDGALNTPLHRAVSKHRSAMAEFLIEKGAHVNARNKERETPLHLAAYYGRLGDVRLLLAHGARMNIENRQHDQPFHLAAHRGYLEVVKTMLEGGYNLKTPGRNQSTPLYLAALGGRLKVVSHLLSGGADINAQNALGSTPLHASLQQKVVAVTKYLLEQGAETGLHDENEQTPLFIAASEERLEMVRVLLDRGESLQQVDAHGRTPLYYGLGDDGGFLTNFLVRKGAEVNHKALNDWTPLHAAAETGNLSSMKFLLSGGATVDAVDTEGRTPLHIAAIRGSLNHVRELLSNNADMLATNNRGEGVLHLVDGTKNELAFLYLLGAGADIELRDRLGNTPFLSIARRLDLGLMEQYVRRGADWAATNDAGETALALVEVQIKVRVANQYWPPAMVQEQELWKKARRLLLRQIGEAMGQAAGSGDIASLERILGTYPDHLQILSKERRPPLWTAARRGQLEVVKWLVARGAHEPYPIKFGMTANDVELYFILHEASRRGHVEVLRYFIEELGFAWDKPNEDGKTPLKMARGSIVTRYLKGLVEGVGTDEVVASESS